MASARCLRPGRCCAKGPAFAFVAQSLLTVLFDFDHCAELRELASRVTANHYAWEIAESGTVPHFSVSRIYLGNLKFDLCAVGTRLPIFHDWAEMPFANRVVTRSPERGRTVAGDRLDQIAVRIDGRPERVLCS